MKLFFEKKWVTVAESFFACMKCEELSHNLYKTTEQLEADVVEYVDSYNSRRVHQKTGQRTSVEFEADFTAAKRMNSCLNSEDYLVPMFLSGNF